VQSQPQAQSLEKGNLKLRYKVQSPPQVQSLDSGPPQFQRNCSGAVSPSKFHFLKEFWLKKNNTFVCVNGKLILFLGLRIRDDKRRESSSAPFRPFLLKMKNTAADLSGRSTCYSALFDLCSRTIGQLATLRPRVQKATVSPLEKELCEWQSQCSSIVEC
jgi:hypothetical protein